MLYFSLLLSFYIVFVLLSIYIFVIYYFFLPYFTKDHVQNQCNNEHTLFKIIFIIIIRLIIIDNILSLYSGQKIGSRFHV